jgi:two-component system OmpR family response regulator
MQLMSLSSGYRARVRRVLFVDDDFDVRHVYAGALRSTGFIVDEVGSIADALAFLETRRPDAVVLDRNLPDGDGIETAPVMRTMHEGIGIVAFTAEPEWAARLAAERCGCDAFVTKASAPEILVEAVRSVLAVRSLARQQVAK